jgi:hypothetical protein
VIFIGLPPALTVRARPNSHRGHSTAAAAARPLLDSVVPLLVGVAAVCGFGFGLARFVLTEMAGSRLALGLVYPRSAGSAGGVAVADGGTGCPSRAVAEVAPQTHRRLLVL